ncbi:hypothetical protein KGF57_003382 [Candida theae]|uniref:Enoyl reductase (ER) domain-containing protein n=1 Tax=Candida theae TaxID=1198502 RepID=A0AAD5BD65_9ASCO|nr:uncharacterized protein KGF57_003382 [Candida theae]KAI5957073.1 hypothetical protein KGF57_003382 [Candida theae]
MSTPSTSTQVVLKTNPPGFVNPKIGESDSTFEIKQRPIEPLKDGQLLVKILYLSNDPTQRGWIRPKDASFRYYVPPVAIGAPMESLAIAEVIESKSSKYSKGDIVNGKFYWADYITVSEQNVVNKIDKSLGFPLEFYLSVLGMTSLTALFGLTEAGEMKKFLSEKPEKPYTLLVSAASGATGSVVVQIAKHVLGASKVIGISGSEEKCRWVESLGADLCVNYKSDNYQKEIDEFLGDGLVDYYFDNVGGSILDYALTKMNKFGHVISCGSISTYNSKGDGSFSGVKSWGEITVNSLTIKGFIVTDFLPKFAEGAQILGKAVKEGKIKAQGAYHVDTLSGDSPEKKLEGIPQIWNQLFVGEKPNGKLITKVA